MREDFTKAKAVEARGGPGHDTSFLAGLVTARLVAPLGRVTRGAWSRAPRFFTPDFSATGLGLGDRAGAFDGGWFLRFHDLTVCPPLQGHNTPLANDWTQPGLVPAGVRLVTSAAATALRRNPSASVSSAGAGGARLVTRPARMNWRRFMAAVQRPRRCGLNEVALPITAFITSPADSPSGRGAWSRPGVRRRDRGGVPGRRCPRSISPGRRAGV